MKKPKPMIAYGASFYDDDPRVSPWTMKGTPRLVRQEVGKQWDASDPVAGWKAARKNGARLVKLEVRIVKPAKR